MKATTSLMTMDIAVDGTDTAKMAKDDLLRETAENALAGNVAKKFNTADDFGAGENVIYNGSEYVIIKDHTAGSWASSDAYKTSDRNISELGKGQLFLKKSLDGNEVIVPSLTKYYVINDLAQKVSLSQNFGSTTDIELHAGKSIYVYCACNRYVSAIAEDLGGDTYQVLVMQVNRFLYSEELPNFPHRDFPLPKHSVVVCHLRYLSERQVSIIFATAPVL